MKKILKNILVLAIMCLMFSSTVSAKQYIDKNNFDYEWYLEKHPDLASIVNKDDQDTIWWFYVNIGEPAGWVGRATRESLIDNSEERQNYVYESIDEVIQAELKIYDLAESLTANCKTDREKIKLVHDWMVMNIKYDYDNYLTTSIPFSSYRITGAMLYGRAVCQGYAEAFELFMNVLGIECELISGTSNNGGGTWVDHAWNRVKLDGKWYYIDVTWDDPVPDSGTSVYWYKYYLVTDPTFGGDHIPAN